MVVTAGGSLTMKESGSGERGSRLASSASSGTSRVAEIVLDRPEALN